MAILGEVVVRIPKEDVILLRAIRGLFYLWTRDAKLPVGEETQSYVAKHLEALARQEAIYSDPERAEMAGELTKIFLRSFEGHCLAPVAQQEEEA